MSAIVGPIAPYSNVPIAPQNYEPNRFVIESLTLGRTTTVTATTDMNFVVGNLVRLLIPQGYGCTQLNNATGYVISLPASDQIVLSIDSSQNVNTFVSAGLPNQPQIVPVGNINNGYLNASGQFPGVNGIPGAYTNIS